MTSNVLDLAAVDPTYATKRRAAGLPEPGAQAELETQARAGVDAGLAPLRALALAALTSAATTRQAEAERLADGEKEAARLTKLHADLQRTIDGLTFRWVPALATFRGTHVRPTAAGTVATTAFDQLRIANEIALSDRLTPQQFCQVCLDGVAADDPLLTTVRAELMAAYIAYRKPYGQAAVADVESLAHGHLALRPQDVLETMQAYLAAHGDGTASDYAAELARGAQAEWSSLVNTLLDGGSVSPVEVAVNAWPALLPVGTDVPGMAPDPLAVQMAKPRAGRSRA